MKPEEIYRLLLTDLLALMVPISLLIFETFACRLQMKKNLIILTCFPLEQEQATRPSAFVNSSKANKLIEKCAVKTRPWGLAK